MYETILNNAPETWSHAGIIERETLPKFSQEYKDLESELLNGIQNSTFEIINIDRIQKVHHYGQFLIREQLYAVNNQETSYYRVRRFVEVDERHESNAIKYNLDTRRCGIGSLNFSKTLHLCGSTASIFVVRVVTDKPLNDIVSPNTTLDYYIEYVVKVSL